MATTREGSGVSAERFNTLVERGRKRALVLEPEVRRVMARVLTDAGRQAASRLTDWASAQSVTAAAPTGWTRPEADVLVKLGELADALTHANRRLRERIMRAGLGEIEAELGVSFDLRNPIIDGVLREAGQNIKHVAESQRQTIMDALSRAWDDGMSIDQAARLVEQRSSAVAMSRARTIARTEIIGIANGGSLAATRLTGAMRQKEWFTAGGAKVPRHHDYPGLDGQLRGLTEKFSVGGAAMAYPGDPAGPAGEVVNCRCTIGYRE